MIVFGIVLLLIGMLAGIAILWSIGVLLVIVGAILWILGAAGHQVGARRHYYCRQPGHVFVVRSKRGNDRVPVLPSHLPYRLRDTGARYGRQTRAGPVRASCRRV
jgi:hypothetical protein